jgi:hypothetical protein
MDLSSGETGGRPRMLGDMVVLRMQNTEKISRYNIWRTGAAMTGKDAKKERTRV